MVAFAGNKSPGNSYETDNPGHEHSPTYDVGKDYKDNMQEVGHYCYFLNLPQI